MHPATDDLSCRADPWEVEHVRRRVLAVTCSTFRLDHSRITIESCLGAEIGVDSLDFVEYIMELEAEFHIVIPNAVAQKWFPSMPVTLGRLADMILALSREGAVARPERPAPAPPAEAATVPFTQLGGVVSAKEWLAGPLYEPMSPNREGLPQYRRRTDGMRCVLVPGGEALVGSDDADALPDQRPAHRVAVNPFLIDAEPVSATAYARFLSSVGPVPPAVLRDWCLTGGGDRREQQFPLRRRWHGWDVVRGTGRQPMVLVSWFGASAYARWANRRDWRRYRGDGTIPAELRDRPAPPEPREGPDTFLPSEAQWEYAARGGQRRRYPWGDEPPTPGRLRAGCHAPGATYTAQTLPAADVAARLGVSPFGLHHMAGNVWQWCRDWYAADFYGSPEAGRPDAENRRPTGIRSERGGSWVGPAGLARSSYRRGRPPAASGRCLGFRCVGPAAECR
jgi:acyl carrier protein